VIDTATATFLSEHQWAVLSTGRRDGSPQSSIIGYCWDGSDVLVTFRRSSAKYHNIRRQPRVALLAVDGRQGVTVYGDAELVEHDPARVEAFAAIMASFGAPEAPHDELTRRLDEEQRVIIRIHPATTMLNV
jgi:PPOX class probable F420-dependent enzyme